MGLTLTKTIISNGIPIWQDTRVSQNAQGGFTLDLTGLIIGTVIPAGTPFTYDEATRLAKPLKVARIQATAGGSATVYQVDKGSNLKVGDYFALTVGGAAYAITAIDTSNAAYDAVTVGTTVGAAAVGDSVFASSATGASAAALPFTPKGLLYQDCYVDTNVSVSVRIIGTVYARRIPPYEAAVETALSPRIIFSQSY